VEGAVVTPAGQNQPAGTLPFTGGDVAGMLLIAGVAIGGGALLLTASKRRTATVAAQADDDHQA
jgi:LPXTG-motif cell wall-anchored protein